MTSGFQMKIRTVLHFSVLLQLQIKFLSLLAADLDMT